MKIYSLETAKLKIDGGAMFGVVPKIMWQRKYPADDNNFCLSACRSMLIDTGERVILIDTGMGNKLSSRELASYLVQEGESLDKSLEAINYKPEQITDVVLTHLHFDHCGGTTNFNAKGEIELAFPDAQHWVSKPQWIEANNPNRREKTSFIKDNFVPIKEAGRLNLIEKDTELFEGLELRLFYGHTKGLLVPFINYNNKTIVFTGDMMPAAAYVPMSWIASFDTQPLITLKEKEVFLKEAYDNNYILFFQHDDFNECGTLKMTERGIRIDKLGTLKEFIT